MGHADRRDPTLGCDWKGVLMRTMSYARIDPLLEDIETQRQVIRL